MQDVTCRAKDQERSKPYHNRDPGLAALLTSAGVKRGSRLCFWTSDRFPLSPHSLVGVNWVKGVRFRGFEDFGGLGFWGF
jgi:hypothetical protein